MRSLALVLPLLSIVRGSGFAEEPGANRMSDFLRGRSRSGRHLLFPDPKESETKVQVLFGLGLPMEGEVSMTLGYVLKCNYDLPYNATDFTEAQERLTRSARSAGGSTSRWTLYRVLESAMEGIGSGKACLLLAVCEAAASPFAEGHGLLGELLHVLLTPSATEDEYESYSDREYRAAELIGTSSRGRIERTCRSIYPECDYDPLDYFTTLGPL